MKKRLPEFIFFLIALVIFLVNARYVSYPDEFVNLLGGKFINAGKIPYKEFFDHHLPFAWYFSAVLLRLAFNSFVLFRFYWAIFSFILLTALGLWIRRNNNNLYPYYLAFLFLYPLLSVYFWLHLYLADSLAALFFSIIFWLLTVQTLNKKKDFKAIAICSFLTFVLIFSSLTYLFAGVALYFWQLYLLRKNLKTNIIKFSLFAAGPYFLYLIYLLISGSVKDFYFANLVYNTQLYIDIPNYVKGRFFNPLKFGLTLIFNFWEGFLPKLVTIKDFNLYLPVSTVTVFGSFVFLILLIMKNWPVGMVFFFILSFSAPRSNLQKAMFETDYQTGLFVVLGLSATVLVIYLLRKLEFKDMLLKDLQRLVSLILIIQLFFTFLFLLKNTYDKWYFRYTQKMPSIYDRSDVSLFLNEILDKDDYFWMGPYEPQEIFFVKKGKLPGKYISLMPQFRQNDEIKKNFIGQFENNPPAVIILKTDTGIFGTPTIQFADFFIEWMKSRYILFADLNETVLKNPTSLKLNSHLYLLNSEKDKIILSLKKAGYIK